MKKNILLFVVAFSSIMVSCIDDDSIRGKREYLVAVPLTSDLRQFKEEAIDISEPEPIQQSGKIYAYNE